MFFARLSGGWKLGLALAVLAVILLLSFFIGYGMGGEKKTSEKAKTDENAGAEVKILRSQEEIAVSYKGSMERLSGRLEEAKDKGEIVSIVSSGFFDIYVPTDLRDLHLQKMLEAFKLMERADLTGEETKEKIILIIKELIKENQTIIESL